MEQKMRQKRQTPIMVQSTDIRPSSLRVTSAHRGKELHGMPPYYKSPTFLFDI